MTEEEEEDERKVENSAVFCWTRNRNTLKVYYMCYTCVACQWAEQLKIVQFEQIKRRLMAKVLNVFCFVETFPECLSTWFENVNDTLSQLFLRSIHESVDVPAFVFVKSIESKANKISCCTD